MSFSGKRGRRTDDANGDDVVAPPPYVKTRVRSLPDTGSIRDDMPLGLLNRPLGPEFVKSRKGPGLALFYLSSSDAVYVANLVFGNDNWSSEVLRQEEDIPHREGDKWAVNAKCRVRVTVNWPSTGQSTFHEGTGYGGGSKGAKTAGDALEMAIKEAETDAFKRALRMFGEALGNCFYDKLHLDWIKKQRDREGNEDASKRFTWDNLLRRHGTATPPRSSQQKLSFESRKNGDGAKVGGPVRLVPTKDEFDDVDSDMFVEDDGYTF